MINLLLAKGYNKIASILHRRLGIDLRGQAYLMRRLREERVFQVKGLKFHFNPKIAGAYVRLINGEFSEPETHFFLNKVLNAVDFTLLFVDVGANIGEFAIEMGAHKKVQSVIAFEPYQEVANTCKINVALNELGNVEIIEKALADEVGAVHFRFDEKFPLCSSIIDHDGDNGSCLTASTLDLEIPNYCGEAVILMDVEGAELKVMKGSRRFIERNKPLIIFEHQSLNKERYGLGDIRHILGRSYQIFRLRHDGCLDRWTDKRTWNCVAVHEESSFWKSCQELLR